LIHQFHALKIERHDRIFEEITSLAQNYLSEEEETVDLSEDFFLSELRGEPLRLEHEIHENRSREIQLRYENEAMRLRRTCQSELKRQDSSQHSIRALFGAAQEEWNTAFIRGRNVPDLSKLADLEQQFEAVAQKVDQLVSSEAEAETELVDAESEEIQRFTEELEKWISDEKLNWLVLQARNEAIQQQIAILKQNGNQADLQDALQRETAEGAALTGMLEDATAKFRQLDVMMGGEDDDEVAPQSRFESIQERIDVVLEEDQSQTSLNAAERELKEQLNRLRKNRR
jgi:hypothetical protein